MSTKITPVLPITGQKLPPQFAEYSTLLAVFHHLYLLIYSTISCEAPNKVPRRQCIPFVALIPTFRTIRYHNPRDHNPSRSLGFDSRPVHGGFVFDKVAMGQIYLRVLRFPPPGPHHSTTAPYSNLIHLPPKLTSTILGVVKQNTAHFSRHNPGLFISNAVQVLYVNKLFFQKELCDVLVKEGRFC
jgi:hypothetical protein